MQLEITIIINGSRKLSLGARKAIELIKNHTNLICRFETTLRPKHAVDLALYAANHESKVIIAVGGDGTCNEVINGICLSKNKSNVFFGIIPNGSGNDFHTNIGEFNPDVFLQSLLSENFKEIDLIQIEVNNRKWYALNIAGIGFDGHVVHTLSKLRNSIGLKGKFAYALSILQSFTTFKKVEATIISDDFNYSGKTLMMAVCNGKAFGHGLIINPDAIIDDGILNVTLLGDVSFIDYVKNLTNLKKGLKVVHPHIHYFKTKSLLIKMKNDTLYSEVDGEIMGQGNVKYKIVPSVINLIC